MAIASVTEGISADLLQQHPEGTGVRPNLEHLYLTYTGTIKGFERCLEAGKPLAPLPTGTIVFELFVVVGIGPPA